MEGDSPRHQLLDGGFAVDWLVVAAVAGGVDFGLRRVVRVTRGSSHSHRTTTALTIGISSFVSSCGDSVYSRTIVVVIATPHKTKYSIKSQHTTIQNLKLQVAIREP